MKGKKNINEKQNIWGEFITLHIKKCLPELLLLSVLVMLTTGIAQALFLDNMYRMGVTGFDEFVEESLFSGANIALMIFFVISCVAYFIFLNKYIRKMYHKLRDDYRVLYMSGYRERKLLWQLVIYPFPVLMIAGLVGMWVVPIPLIGVISLVDINGFIYIMIMIITYMNIRDAFKGDFYAITGLYDIQYDISKVDGSYKFIQEMTVAENIALPNRILWNRRKNDVVYDVAGLMSAINMDNLMYTRADNLTNVQSIKVMIVRAYSVSGREMTLDENLLRGLNEKDVAQIEDLIVRVKNSYVDERYIPVNMAKRDTGNNNDYWENV